MRRLVALFWRLRARFTRQPDTYTLRQWRAIYETDQERAQRDQATHTRWHAQ